ncbi:uncharacterized protein K460DRAFT_369756 [Cucurbitaria berberidis CBS 394.84]|uniref:Uncharacterized protein n=1 Tax=Cucurbitaria berberidis CBS 394.84 TaxID=1168544 RepID=A0A9P4GA99_9PLEO|nr:uncharacterized protein K460DRAFT_369756 [Cucurbitaria berberidis CBS 394.84]KAF1841752.1 hypothetical protein K460DRAFT_369756 [Cucurbitaria berberidis CBS 394.84]
MALTLDENGRDLAVRPALEICCSCRRQRWFKPGPFPLAVALCIFLFPFRNRYLVPF